jgi:hypothetical protein
MTDVEELHHCSQEIRGLFNILYTDLQSTALGSKPQWEYLSQEEAINLGHTIHYLSSLMYAATGNMTELDRKIEKLFVRLAGDNQRAKFPEAV